MVKRRRTMPPRKEKEIPKKYVDSEEEEETSKDTSEDQDDKDAVDVLDNSLTSKKPALYDAKGQLLSTGQDLCDCLEQVCFSGLVSYVCLN